MAGGGGPVLAVPARVIRALKEPAQRWWGQAIFVGCSASLCYYACMARTTINLPDDLAAALKREARRRGVPVSQIAREAIEARLGRVQAGRREIPFAALGRSGHRSTARDLEAILEAEWGLDRDR